MHVSLWLQSSQLHYRVIGTEDAIARLFVAGLVSYSRYLCLYAHSGVQHIMCCVFVLFVFVLCALYC
jgi:hypothetical protein